LSAFINKQLVRVKQIKKFFVRGKIKHKYTKANNGRRNDSGRSGYCRKEQARARFKDKSKASRAERSPSQTKGSPRVYTRQRESF